MKTLTKGIKISEAVKIAKPFVGSLRAKSYTRPVLKTVLVTESHVIATDACILIRMKHDESVAAPYLHHYKPEVTEGYEAHSYPQTDRLIPDPMNAKSVHTLNVAEWMEAHEGALPAAKEHFKHNPISLDSGTFHVKPVSYKDVKCKGAVSSDGIRGYKTIKVPEFDQISYTYTLDDAPDIEKVSYNVEYMLMALKAAKKLKHKTVDMYFYGPMRPMLFTAGDLEVILLPIRMK